MKILNLFLLLLIMSFSSQAQNSYIECETEPTPAEINNIQKALSQFNNRSNKTAADSNVPIKVHIIANSNGTGGIDSAAVFNELSICNQRYAGAGIRFVHCGNIDYINSDNYTSFEKYVDETICDNNDAYNVLNLYFVQDLYRISGTDTTYLCGYAYLSDVTKNRLIVENSCAQNSSTLAHEIGHYFSLLHTHSTSAGNELVDGSNCTTAGDGLCDTPADPRLSTSNVDAACNYTGTTTDGNNQAYMPNARNILSYSRKTCRDFFSPQQLARMNDYWLTYRNYLNCGAAPVGVKNVTIQNSIQLYPNPSNYKITVSASDEILSLKVYSTLGQIVTESKAGNAKKVSLNITDLPQGIYIAEVITAKEKKIIRIVKQY